MKAAFRIIRSGTSLLGLLLILISTTPLVGIWGRALAGPWEDPKGDILIVLGAAGETGGLLSVSSYWRTVYALRAYREGGVQRIVVSGGSDRDGNSISQPMVDFLVSQGVPRDKILVEFASTNTRENALFTAALLRDVSGSKVLLTSDYHMYRASRAFQKAGLPVLPRPFPDVLKRTESWQGRWPAFLVIVGETAKIMYYRVRGWI